MWAAVRMIGEGERDISPTEIGSSKKDVVRLVEMNRDKHPSWDEYYPVTGIVEIGIFDRETGRTIA